MASLTVVVEGVEQKVPLESASVTLGRGLESDVRLKDIKASRRHCQVVKTAKGYQCVDLSSGNGTYVNGVQIKQQMLNPGDRITIGSTTIVFEDAPRQPAVSSKTATAKLPVAAAPPPAPARGGTSKKVATAKVTVAPTKRTTERVEAVKPASQQALKPATHPVSKTGSRVGKPTARTGSSRPARTAAAEAPAKKSPVLFVAIGVVVLGLAAGGWFLFGRDNGDQVKEQVDALLKKARAAESQEHYDAAVAEYKKALELCQGDRYKMRASEITKLLAQIESRRGTGQAPPVKPEPKDVPEKADGFPARKAEIAEKHKLAAASGADWAGALKDWADYLARKPAADGAAKAQAEVKAIQAKAREELAALRKKVDALVKENKMAEAVDLLKQQAPRFEGTDAQPDLEAAIKQYDK